MIATLLILGGAVFGVLGVLHAIYTLLDLRNPRRLVPVDPSVAQAMTNSALRLSGGRARTCGERNLIVDENRQPIGRPWLSLAVHAACSQILTIKGQRFALSSAKTVGMILTIKCQKSPRNRDS